MAAAEAVAGTAVAAAAGTVVAVAGMAAGVMAAGVTAAGATAMSASGSDSIRAITAAMEATAATIPMLMDMDTRLITAIRIPMPDIHTHTPDIHPLTLAIPLLTTAIRLATLIRAITAITAINAVIPRPALSLAELPEPRSARRSRAIMTPVLVR